MGMENLRLLLTYENKVCTLEGEDGSFKWSYTMDPGEPDDPAVGDIDGDGLLEIVIPSDDGNVYALNGEDGSLLWEFVPAGIWFQPPVLPTLIMTASLR